MFFVLTRKITDILMFSSFSDVIILIKVKKYVAVDCYIAHNNNEKARVHSSSASALMTIKIAFIVKVLLRITHFIAKIVHSDPK